MCGLVGIVGDDVRTSLLAHMAAQIAHRGPDDAGTWSDPDARIGLGHVRLSIVDLSPAGHQPMHAHSGRYVLAFNGEVYNHAELRHALTMAGEAPAWRGHSDTETLLACMDAWGIEATVRMAVGMFAMAIWDRKERTTTLCRDRLGEKPLYYGRAGSSVVFGSELAALRVHPAFNPSLDTGSLALLLRLGYIPAPWSIYQDIRKLTPGTLLVVRQDGQMGEPVPYWDPAQMISAGLAQPYGGSPEEATDRLEELLLQAVQGQRMGDVPTGAFLSGGIDSSTVVALMQKGSASPIRTFSIGFHEANYDEAGHARAVARHLGTAHTELYVTPQDALDVIPRLPKLYDEPFADSSQIPTFLVSQLARTQVTVSLSGDGADELFGGYSRYTTAAARWQLLQHVPRPLKRLAGAASRQPPLGLPAVPAAMRGVLRQLDRAHRSTAALSAPDFARFYLSSVSGAQHPAGLVRGSIEHPTRFAPAGPGLQRAGLIESMMATDLVTYLPDDILCKVDRAAMAVSLETRAPFLDHRVVEFAWQLPLALKIRDGKSKWLLRQVLARHVPPALTERPKMGFAVPVLEWLRGPLREWAESLLSPQLLREQGLLDPQLVRARWLGFLNGQMATPYELWPILMFQAWWRQQRELETTVYRTPRKGP